MKSFFKIILGTLFLLFNSTQALSISECIFEKNKGSDTYSINFPCKVTKENRLGVGPNSYYTYYGDYSDYLFHGQGTLIWKNGDKYEGDFWHSEMHGFGTFSYNDGSKYIGEFKNNFKEGKGTFIWSNGDKYEGQFWKDKKEGLGLLSYKNGDKYDGEWRKNKKQGYGKQMFNGGKVEDGLWKDDKFDQIQTYLWLGNIHRDGEGVLQNYNIAFQNYKLSAEGGNKFAMMQIVNLYKSFKITPKLSLIEKIKTYLSDNKFLKRKSLINAHMWANLSGDKELRDSIELDTNDISESQKLAQQCLKKKYKNC